MRGRPLTHEEAAAHLAASDYEPAEKYPGTTDASWRAWCLRCRAQVWVKVSAVHSAQIKRGGAPRTRCAHPSNRVIVPAKDRLDRHGGST